MPNRDNKKVLGHISMLAVHSGYFILEVTHQGTATTVHVSFDNDSIKMAGALSQYQMCRDAMRGRRKILVEYNDVAAHRPIVDLSIGDRVDEMRYQGSRIVEVDSTPVLSLGDELGGRFKKKGGRKKKIVKKTTRKKAATKKRAGKTTKKRDRD